MMKLYRLFCRSSLYIASIRRAVRLDKQKMRLFQCDRTVFHSPRNNIKIARGQLNLVMSELDCQMAFQHKKEVISIFM